MIQVNSFAVIIGIIFFLSCAIYFIDMFYALKYQIAISEFKLTELVNKLNLIERETPNKIAALLNKKEILNLSTIPEPSSYFNSNTFYGLIILGSLIFVGYVAQSISFSYTTFSNNGIVKVVSRVDDGSGYVATSLVYNDNNLIKDSPLPTVEFERLDEVLQVLPEIVQLSPLIHDPNIDPTVIWDILHSLP